MYLWRTFDHAIPLLVRSGGSGAAGVVGHTVTWLVSDHPVCGTKVGFAEIFLMPQPPLLTRRGLRVPHTTASPHGLEPRRCAIGFRIAALSLRPRYSSIDLAAPHSNRIAIGGCSDRFRDRAGKPSRLRRIVSSADTRRQATRGQDSTRRAARHRRDDP